MSRKQLLQIWANDALWLSQPIAGITWLLARRLLMTLIKVFAACVLLITLIVGQLVSLVVILLMGKYRSMDWAKEKLSFDRW